MQLHPILILATFIHSISPKAQFYLTICKPINYHANNTIIAHCIHSNLPFHIIATMKYIAQTHILFPILSFYLKAATILYPMQQMVIKKGMRYIVKHIPLQHFPHACYSIYLPAITDISTFTPRGKPATCTVSRAGALSLK